MSLLWCSPQLAGGLRQLPTHNYAAVLNFAIAKNFHEQELCRHGAIYGMARQSDGLSAGLEEASPGNLSAWLGMDMK